MARSEIFNIERVAKSVPRNAVSEDTVEISITRNAANNGANNSGRTTIILINLSNQEAIGERGDWSKYPWIKLKIRFHFRYPATS
ncbi:MAG: hypothetical protein H7232_18055 [Aeromicrobium sp.]|nr:hypothetical protein [Burkholderiales bacterium]